MGTGYTRHQDDYPKGTTPLQLCSVDELVQAIPHVGDWDLQEVDFYATGVRGTEFQQLSRKLADGVYMGELVPEPHNPADHSALAIDIDGERLGYVSARVACYISWHIQILNNKGYRCQVPVSVENYDYDDLPDWARAEDFELDDDEDAGTYYVCLPTIERLTENFGFAEYEDEITQAWRSLPQDILLAEVKELGEHPVRLETIHSIFSSQQIPRYLLPLEADPDYFPYIWHQAFQPVRREIRFQQEEEKRREREARDNRIAELFATGLSQAAVGRELGISPSTVRKALIAKGVIQGNNSTTPPRLEPEAKREVLLTYASESKSFDALAAQFDLPKQEIERIIRSEDDWFYPFSYRMADSDLPLTSAVEDPEALRLKQKELLFRLKDSPSISSIQSQYGVSEEDL